MKVIYIISGEEGNMIDQQPSRQCKKLQNNWSPHWRHIVHSCLYRRYKEKAVNVVSSSVSTLSIQAVFKISGDHHQCQLLVLLLDDLLYLDDEEESSIMMKKTTPEEATQQLRPHTKKNKKKHNVFLVNKDNDVFSVGVFLLLFIRRQQKTTDFHHALCQGPHEWITTRDDFRSRDHGPCGQVVEAEGHDRTRYSRRRLRWWRQLGAGWTDEEVKEDKKSLR